MPVVTVQQVGANKRSDGAQFTNTPQQFLACQVDIMEWKHSSEFQLVGTVLAELVDPVVVGLAQGQGELWIHSVARDEAEATSREQDGNINSFHLHRHDLGFGVVTSFDGEAQPSSRSRARGR